MTSAWPISIWSPLSARALRCPDLWERVTSESAARPLLITGAGGMLGSAKPAYRSRRAPSQSMQALQKFIWSEGR